MLDLDFCLAPFNSSLTEDNFEDNPFSLDFSDAELISPPSSEDEGEDEDERDAGEDTLSISHSNDVDTVMNHRLPDSNIAARSSYSDFERPAGIGPSVGNHDTIVPNSDDDDDEPLPLEFEITSTCHLIPDTSSRPDFSTSAERCSQQQEEPNKEQSSLADAKKKLDACMRRTEHTRRWINQYVKKTSTSRASKKKETSKRVAVVSTVPSASFSKHKFRWRGRGVGTPYNKSGSEAAVKLVREASFLVREKGSNFESSGVLHRSSSILSDNSPQTGRTTKASSISDFLRKSRKSASMMIY